MFPELRRTFVVFLLLTPDNFIRQRYGDLWTVLYAKMALCSFFFVQQLHSVHSKTFLSLTLKRPTGSYTTIRLLFWILSIINRQFKWPNVILNLQVIELLNNNQTIEQKEVPPLLGDREFAGAESLPNAIHTDILACGLLDCGRVTYYYNHKIIQLPFM